MKFICQKYPKLQMTYKTEVVKEVNGTIIKEKTQLIQFEGGFYETEDKDKIAFIKRHVDFSNGCIVQDESEIYQHHAIKESDEELTPVVEAKKVRGRPKKVE